MTKKIQVYFQTVTQESATLGDFAETGEHDTHDCTPDKWDLEENKTAVDLAVETLMDQGYLEASSSDFHSDIWYQTADPDTNYRTGEETYYTFHLKGFSEAEALEVYNRLMNRG